MKRTDLSLPRLLVVGASGDSGKTLVALSLIRAARQRGMEVAAFKKGPDYIDAAWLTRAASRPARNLDTYLMGPQGVTASFFKGWAGADMSVIEGNRGLFDGFDEHGSHSSAELARLLGVPVIVVLPVDRVEATAAAFIRGCQILDPALPLAGVILNHVRSPAHRDILVRAIRERCGVEVLGALDDLGQNPLPGRHLGLVTPEESQRAEAMLAGLADLAQRSLDLERIWHIARSAPPLAPPEDSVPLADGGGASRRVRLACFRDSAFTFYYPENLEALEAAGAQLVPVSPLRDDALPEVDGLYIGGGFPETHGELLANNRAFLASVRRAAEGGMPIYAECGGLIFLSRSLRWQGKEYPLCGVLPVDLDTQARPKGHGYCRARVDRPNPFLPVGLDIRGHEFHYSFVMEGQEGLESAYALQRGTGCFKGRDGLVRGNVLASYLHIHALATPEWAPGLVAAARAYRRG